MTDLTTESFGALLDEFVAAQRRQELDRVALQKITAQRSVGQACTIVCEVTVPQGADADTIYAALAPWDNAIDRLKAKSDLADHYFRMLNKCGEIEMSMTKLAHDQVAFSMGIERRNESRRVARTYTTAQKATLDGHRTSIRAGFDAIEEGKKAADECRRVLGGEDPFLVLEGQISARLERLRGTMREDVAA